MPDIVTPIIHLNGTSKERLFEARECVYHALCNLYALMAEIAPNGRDYYPEPGRMERAIEQHQRRSKVIADLQAEIGEEMEMILDGD